MMRFSETIVTQYKCFKPVFCGGNYAVSNEQLPGIFDVLFMSYSIKRLCLILLIGLLLISLSLIIRYRFKPDVSIARNSENYSYMRRHRIWLTILSSAVYAYTSKTEEFGQGDDFPLNLNALITAENLEPSALQHPDFPNHPTPCVYVRPSVTASSRQPMIVEDPALNQAGFGRLALCDTSFLLIRNTDLAKRIWIKAVELAESPKSASSGIEANDWGKEIMEEMHR